MGSCFSSNSNDQTVEEDSQVIENLSIVMIVRNHNKCSGNLNMKNKVESIFPMVVSRNSDEMAIENTHPISLFISISVPKNP